MTSKRSQDLIKSKSLIHSVFIANTCCSHLCQQDLWPVSSWKSRHHHRHRHPPPPHRNQLSPPIPFTLSISDHIAAKLKQQSNLNNMITHVAWTVKEKRLKINKTRLRIKSSLKTQLDHQIKQNWLKVIFCQEVRGIAFILHLYLRFYM